MNRVIVNARVLGRPRRRRDSVEGEASTATSTGVNRHMVLCRTLDRARRRNDAPGDGYRFRGDGMITRRP